MNRPRLLILLHGLTGNHAVWAVRTDLQALADKHSLVIVLPDGARSFWLDQAVGLRWGKWVGSELPELVRATLRVSRRREDTFVGGLSMGGYGAFRAAFDHPHNFAGAFALSGTLDVAEEAFRGRHPDLYEVGFGNPLRPRPEDDLVARVLERTGEGVYPDSRPVPHPGADNGDLGEGANADYGHDAIPALNSEGGGGADHDRDTVPAPNPEVGGGADHGRDTVPAPNPEVGGGARCSLADVRYFAVCGESDRLLEQNRRFRDAAGQAGLKLEYREGPGHHNYRFWNEWLPVALDRIVGLPQRGA